MPEREFVQTLLDKQLCYLVKLPGTEGYELGFNTTGKYTGDIKECTHIFRAACDFKIWFKNERIKQCFRDAPYEVYAEDFQRMFGLKIVRVGYGYRNDFALDFGKKEVILKFESFRTHRESWRLIAPNENKQLIASNRLCWEPLCAEKTL